MLFSIIYISIGILPKSLTQMMPLVHKFCQKSFMKLTPLANFLHNLHAYQHIALGFDLYYATSGIYSIKKSFMKLTPGEQASFAGLKKRIISLISVLCGENWARDIGWFRLGWVRLG